MLANCQDIGGFAKKRVKLLFYKVVRHQKNEKLARYAKRGAILANKIPFLLIFNFRWTMI